MSPAVPMPQKAKPMTQRIASAVPLLALLVLAAGCAQKPLCPELGSCGGPDPLGAWQLAPGYPSCTEDLYVPQTDLRLAQNNKTPALVPPPEPAVYDWCDQLVASGAGKINLNDPAAYTESVQIGQASVKFNPDGTYTAGMTRTGVFVLDLPAACVREFGARDGLPIDPNDPMSPIGNVCQQIQKPVNDDFTNSGAVFNTVCVPNPQDPQGCVCRFDASSTGGPVGFWKRLNTNTLELNNQANFPTKIVFCNRGSELELTGANGDYLFGVRGLRTFKLKAGMMQ
jgi:hypothetical protein